MKKFITIVISCSLALAAGALAQQDESSPAPGKKKHQQPAQGQPAQGAPEGQPPANPQAQRPAARPHPGMRGQEQGAARRNARSDAMANEQSPAPRHSRAEKPATEPAPANPDQNANPQAGHQRKGPAAHQQPAAAMENDTAKPTTPAPAKAGAQSTQPETAAQANPPNAQTNRRNAPANKPDVQAIKAQHANFHAQPKPQQVPAVTFSQNRTISGSQHWQGEKYTVFRSYHPAIHDQVWYRSHFNRIELIGGGYYYFNGGYWYPAWGYQPSAQYYAYDGPIYAGREAEPPDRVIADVQAALQAQGYYKGEVDGLLGPLTREALTGYQGDNGLYETAAIDEPTLDSLGLG